MLPAGTGYTTLEFKISFIKGMTKDTGAVRTEGRTLNVGRRAATAEARITDAKGRLLAHATTARCLGIGVVLAADRRAIHVYADAGSRFGFVYFLLEAVIDEVTSGPAAIAPFDLHEHRWHQAAIRAGGGHARRRTDRCRGCHAAP